MLVLISLIASLIVALIIAKILNRKFSQCGFACLLL
nr:MAG TPA: Protein of unknown function (DUF1043) [Caudoviricetes sp.]